MSWVLGVDTSHYVAVGLAHGGKPVDRSVVRDSRAHLESLLPLITEVMGRNNIGFADIDAFAVGMGPGPFTGLRVGIAAVEALAFASDRPLSRVCSLDVLAAQFDGAPAEFLVASDARRKELYWAHYVDAQRRGEPQVSAPRDLPDLPVVGDIPESYAAQLTVIDGPRQLDPALLAALASDLPTAPGEPYYLRPADAAIGGAPKSTLPRLRIKR